MTPFSRTERILAGAVLVLLVACVTLVWPRPPRPAAKAWFECGWNDAGTILRLVAEPRCCVAPGVVREHCTVMLAYEGAIK